MNPLINPFSLGPADERFFIGRNEILDRWRQRLTVNSDMWRNGKSWMIIAPGGIGKTSLLTQMQQIAKKEFKAAIVVLDLGHYCDLNSVADFFSSLDGQLPNAQHLSTRMREWLKLEPDASASTLYTRLFWSILERVAVSVSPGLWSIEISGSAVEQQLPVSITTQLAQSFNNLAVLSEEQKVPVVVLIDQAGKADRDYRWRFIIEQLLTLTRRTRLTNTLNLIFVFAMRPERKGKLEHSLSRELFADFLFQYEDLRPFSTDEAVKAILVRDRAHISGQVATKIVNTISSTEGISPYSVQLASSAIWDYLYRDSKPKSPNDLSIEDVKRIIAQGHEYLVSPFREKLVHWEVLKLLAFHPGGLTISEITLRLKDSPGVPFGNTATDAINELINQNKRWLIIAIQDHNSLPRYTIAHDLLREYISSQLPVEERLTERARRALNDGAWRYHQHNHPLSDEELDLIKSQCKQLIIESDEWEAIIFSSLYTENFNLIFEWVNCNPTIVVSVLCNMPWPATKKVILLRALLVQAIISKKPMPLLMELAVHSENPDIQIGAVEILAQFRENSYQYLIQLVKSDNKEVSAKATSLLINFGSSVLPLLAEVLTDITDERSRLEVSKALLGIGHEKLLLQTLVEIVDYSQNIEIRNEAIHLIAKLPCFIASISALENFARSLDKPKLQIQAVEALAEFGEAALAPLGALIYSPPNHQIRWKAIQLLPKLGRSARPILSELSQYKFSSRIRNFAQEALQTLETNNDRSFNSNVHDNCTKEASELLQSISLQEEIKSFASELTIQSTHNPGILQRLTWLKKKYVDLDEEQRTLVALVYESSKWKKAIARLVEIGEPAFRVLSELAMSLENNKARVAAKALAQQGTPAQQYLIQLAMQASDNLVRIEAAVALALLGDKVVSKSTFQDILLTEHNWGEHRLQAAKRLIEFSLIPDSELLKWAWTQFPNEIGASAALKIVQKIMIEDFNW